MLRHLKIKTRNDESDVMMLLKDSSSNNCDHTSNSNNVPTKSLSVNTSHTINPLIEHTVTTITDSCNVTLMPEERLSDVNFTHEVSKCSSIISSLASTSSASSASSDSSTNVMTSAGSNDDCQHEEKEQKGPSRVVIIGIPDGNGTTRLQTPQPLNNDDSRERLTISLPAMNTSLSSLMKRKTITPISLNENSGNIATHSPKKKIRTMDVISFSNPSTISVNSQETTTSLNRRKRKNDRNCNSNSDTTVSTNKYRKSTNIPVIEDKNHHKKKPLHHPMAKTKRRTKATGKSKPTNVSCTEQVNNGSRLVNTLGVLELPEDHLHLSPLHCFVRKNIEAFTASAAEISAPSPGRKVPVKLGQVGLRCIHCTRNLHQVHAKGTKGNKKDFKKRIKRTVCYPSSTSRVYHTISDMKFDHFAACPFLPEDKRAEFNRLKKMSDANRITKGTQRRKNNSKTAEYYRETAKKKFGMNDTKDGIFICVPSQSKPPIQPQQKAFSCANFTVNHPTNQFKLPSTNCRGASCITDNQSYTSLHAQKTRNHAKTLYSQIIPQIKSPSFDQSIENIKKEYMSQRKYVCSQSIPGKDYKHLGSSQSSMMNIPSPLQHSQAWKIGKRYLATPQDEFNLNELHCFVRKNIEVFSANQCDIAAPSPGRKKPLTIGQVGIRCIHCVHLPYKDRVKRAVCYPPSISTIYHAVSNMKFDHFGACRGLTPQLRAEFQWLKKKSMFEKDRKTTKVKTNNSNSTSQYYSKSAYTLGLVDTDTGMRFIGSDFNTFNAHKYPTTKNVVPIFNPPCMNPQIMRSVSSPPNSMRCNEVKKIDTKSKSENKSCSTSSQKSSSPDDGMSLLMLAATDPWLRAQYKQSNRVKREEISKKTITSSSL